MKFVHQPFPHFQLHIYTHGIKHVNIVYQAESVHRNHAVSSANINNLIATNCLSYNLGILMVSTIFASINILSRAICRSKRIFTNIKATIKNKKCNNALQSDFHDGCLISRWHFQKKNLWIIIFLSSLLANSFGFIKNSLFKIGKINLHFFTRSLCSSIFLYLHAFSRPLKFRAKFHNWSSYKL